MQQELTTDAPDIPLDDLIMSKDMAEALHAAYPGHLWAVQVSHETGMADIRNLYLSGNWGYRIKIPAIYSASDFKKQVLRGGGEMLERYRLRRGAADHAAIANMVLDHRGNAIADKTR